MTMAKWGFPRVSSDADRERSSGAPRRTTPWRHCPRRPATLLIELVSPESVRWPRKAQGAESGAKVPNAPRRCQRAIADPRAAVASSAVIHPSIEEPAIRFGEEVLGGIPGLLLNDSLVLKGSCLATRQGNRESRLHKISFRAIVRRSLNPASRR